MRKIKNNNLPIYFSIFLILVDQVTKFLYVNKLNITFTFHREYIFFLIIIVIFIRIILKDSTFLSIQRWTIWLIIAGWISNLINNLNIFHIVVYTYNLHFNIAYITVAISSLIVLLSLLFKDRSQH